MGGKLQQQGFSLFESLLVTGLLAVIVSIGATIFYFNLRGQDKALASKELRQAGSAAALAMEDYLNRFAHRPLACPVSDASSIAFLGYDGGITTFSCRNGHLASNSAYLSPEGVHCDRLAATCKVTSEAYPQVDIAFTFSIANNNANTLQIVPGKKEAIFQVTKLFQERI